MNEVDSEFFRKSFSEWARLSEEEKRLIVTHSKLVRYKKGQNIHGNKGGCTGALLVKSGSFRMYEGDVCMLTASCVLTSITFDVFVDAELDSEVYIVCPNALGELMRNNVYVENYALRKTTERFSEVMWTMQQILFMSFDRRLALFLLKELEKTGGDTVRLTQEQIAKYTGSAREVVSRMLKYFAGEKLVEVSRGGVRVLDPAALKAFAGD